LKKPVTTSKASPAESAGSSKTPEKVKQTRLSQSDVPAYGLEEALRVSAALSENYAGGPATPLNVAIAMGLTPTSSHFRMLTGAAIAYGLTDGGYNSQSISNTELAKRIHSPVEEDQDLQAKRQAFLKPRVISEFLTKYNGHAIPKQPISGNVLIELGVPRDRVNTVLELIISTAKNLGLTQEVKGKLFGNIDGASVAKRPESFLSDPYENETEELKFSAGEDRSNVESLDDRRLGQDRIVRPESSQNRKVFITHGKNKGFVDPIKRLLSFGEMEAIVSVDRQSVSQPVPDKVLEDMRLCGAAIIHVDGEQVMLDKDAAEHVVLNPNVLIEIGAAMALYKRRFILLVKNGIKLPSNLQGLYEVRYEGDTLDGDATIRLLEAINQLKNQPAES
jgi:predicted nucleotide-binding protein